MICSQCQKKEASVHFKGVINNKTIKLDLCEDCAEKSGLPLGDFDSPFSLITFLLTHELRF